MSKIYVEKKVPEEIFEEYKNSSPNEDVILELVSQLDTESVNKTDGRGNTIISHIITNNHQCALHKLIFLVPLKDIKKEYWGWDTTPLIHAIEVNNLDIVKILLNNGADINDTNRKKESALIKAIYMGHKEIYTYLLSSEWREQINPLLTDIGGTCAYHASLLIDDLELQQDLLNLFDEYEHRQSQIIHNL